jgi:hypothetical protein
MKKTRRRSLDYTSTHSRRRGADYKPTEGSRLQADGGEPTTPATIMNRRRLCLLPWGADDTYLCLLPWTWGADDACAMGATTPATMDSRRRLCLLPACYHEPWVADDACACYHVYYW